VVAERLAGRKLIGCNWFKAQPHECLQVVDIGQHDGRRSRLAQDDDAQAV
jgi:hypothetical protein